VSHRPTLWAYAIVGVSLLLLAVTPLAYGLGGRGTLTLALFTLGLGGEGNVGAWWSGMLFLLAAVLALDRTADARRTLTERRGWAVLAAAFALLSFDEVASLHEFLGARNNNYLLPLGALGLSLVAYSLTQLRRANVPLQKLLLGFGMLATVPLQQWLQATLERPNAWIYGAGALLEEGTEIGGALALIAAAGGGLLRLRVGDQTFGSLAWLGTPLLWLAVGAFPLVAGAVYPLNLVGVANWFGAGLFLACALLALRGAALRGEPPLPLAAAVYLLASLGSVAVRPDWDTEVLGQAVNLRGIYFGSLLLTAPWFLSAGEPWPRRAFWLALAGCTFLAAFVLLRPQVVWSTWPPTVALLCFYIEVATPSRLRRAVARDDHAAPTLVNPP
jgi:hypothetical protein